MAGEIRFTEVAFFDGEDVLTARQRLNEVHSSVWFNQPGFAPRSSSSWTLVADTISSL